MTAPPPAHAPRHLTFPLAPNPAGGPGDTAPGGAEGRPAQPVPLGVAHDTGEQTGHLRAHADPPPCPPRVTVPVAPAGQPPSPPPGAVTSDTWASGSDLPMTRVLWTVPNTHPMASAACAPDGGEDRGSRPPKPTASPGAMAVLPRVLGLACCVVVVFCCLSFPWCPKGY